MTEENSTTAGAAARSCAEGIRELVLERDLRT
jgi:hypothetical protein